MKIIKLKIYEQEPKNYTGIIKQLDTKNIIVRTLYLKNGKVHREDGPAVIWKNGNKYYFLNDRYIDNQELFSFLVLTFVKNGKKIPEFYYSKF